MGKKKKSSGWRWVLLSLVLLAAAGLLTAYVLTPGASPPQVGEGDILIAPGEDGGILLSWPAPGEGVVSRVSLRRAGEQSFQSVGDFTENQTVLDGDVLGGKLAIRVQSVAHGKNLLGMDRELVSRRAVEAEVEPRNLVEPVLSGRTGSDGDLHLSWNGAGGYEVSTLDGGVYTSVCRVNGDKTVIYFGEDGDLPLPDHDQTVWITVRPAYQGEGYVLYGPYAQPVSVSRTALMGNVLSLECRNLGDRLYELVWNETKGDYYEVQKWADGGWETLERVEHGEELRYETAQLRSGSDHRYRVAAVGAGESVEPATVSFRVEISTKYATIWPVVNLELYADENMKASLGTIPAGTALCVLEEGDDCFQVRWRDQYGWVDSRFCMINLPEYVGDICAYDVTNSYSSIFMVHGSPIEHITGQVIKGFEGVQTADGAFLVPYLYPSAKKLLTAARAAEEDGYRLRIYEAFRPNEATRFLYDTTMAQLDCPLPERGADGEYIFFDPPEPAPESPEESTEPTAESASPEEPEPAPEDEPVLPPDDAVGEGQTAPAEEATAQAEPASQMESTALAESAAPAESAATEASGTEQEPAAAEETAPAAPSGPTYREIMTDGRFGISSFLAASVSAHNRGIALDMTIERLDGSELEMQSDMHDLSWYSATSRNNENAKLLESYMTGVGMRGLSSEWWHFQDDATREAIGLSKYLTKGVTAEGWTRDNVGWRYRDAKGNFLKNTTVTVDGKQYSLDREGYASE